MAKIKNIEDSLCWRGWSKKNTPPLLVGVQTCTATVEISIAVSHKIRNQSTSRSSGNTLGNIPKGYTIMPQGHLLNNVHSIIIHNS